MSEARIHKGKEEKGKRKEPAGPNSEEEVLKGSAGEAKELKRSNLEIGKKSRPLKKGPGGGESNRVQLNKGKVRGEHE